MWALDLFWQERLGLEAALIPDLQVQELGGRLMQWNLARIESLCDRAFCDRPLDEFRNFSSPAWICRSSAGAMPRISLRIVMRSPSAVSRWAQINGAKLVTKRKRKNWTNGVRNASFC